jgi:hypothetical protein
MASKFVSLYQFGMAFKVTLPIVWLMVTFSVLDAHKLTYSSEGDTVM